MKTNKNYFKKYEEIEKNIKFLSNSDIKFNILKLLLDKPYSIKDLEKKLNYSPSALSDNARKLEDKSYVKKESGVYTNLNFGKIHGMFFMETKLSIDVIIDLLDFWEDHKVLDFPKNLVANLSDLNESCLVEYSPSDIHKTHNTLKNFLMNSKSNIKAIFPFFHPEYPSIFENLLNNNVNCDIVLVKEIATKFREAMNYKIIKKELKANNFHMEVSQENINFLLVLSDDFIALSLFKNDNSFDQNRLLISTKKEAIRWGMNLFYHYYGHGKNIFLKR